MNKLLVRATVVGAATALTAAICAQDETAAGTRQPAAGTRHPAKIGKEEMEGKIFERPDMIRTDHGAHTTLDVTTLVSSDGKFATGMYRSGAVRSHIDEPYGVDEFMYFIEGGVRLTSTDGTVQEIDAGEAVTIPKEWTGIWDTDGYTKIWVIYSEDGSGLE